MKVLAAAAPLPQRSFFTHRIIDPIPAPIRQTGSIKDVGNFKAKSGIWKLISYDFGAEDPPRHVGNEGFRVFGERGNLTPTII
ncbi:unnamed protein product [Malus baccata var. baccata]